MTSRRGIFLAGAASALSAGAFLAGCAGNRAGSTSRPGIVNVPGVRPSDWEPASPASHGMDATALAATLQAGSEVSALRSLLVVRNGMLMAESYYGGVSASDVLPVNSITKSVSSMLVGQALQRGTLPGLSAPLRQLLPETLAQVPGGSAAADITLEQILTGRSGLVYDWQLQGPALASAPDPARYALGLPVNAMMSTVWNYNDAAVGLITPLLARAEGMDLAAVAERDLFKPLGIQQYSWRRDRMGKPTAYGGLALRQRDLMKLVWMMLDGGRWQGASVLPAAWVGESTRPRGPASWRVVPMSDIGYGYLWFTGTLHGKAVAWGWGYGGQVAMLVPELKLAIGVTATSPSMEALVRQTGATMALVARVVQAAA